jgi:hypothetical protein
MMNDKCAASDHKGESEREGEKRQYEKPAIAEEESYETCATLACAMKDLVYRCRSNPRNS